MQESEWLECRSPTEMLRFLGPRISGRKLRLYGCAGCRRLWWMLWDERSRNAVEVSERFADGLASAEELNAAAALAQEAVREFQPPRFGANAAETALMTTQSPGEAADRAATKAADADMLRDLCGNPFRPVTIDPFWLAWNDGTVVRMAQAIYEDGLFTHLPILADALEEAGCNNPVILAHCRQPGGHQRGCWLVDLLLGKE
jgi:hypothetical protein